MKSCVGANLWLLVVMSATHVNSVFNVMSPVLLTSVLQCHHHGLLYKVPLDEAAEVVPVHGEVR